MVLDLGTGFNTPIVARWPAERITASRTATQLLRINREHPDVPSELADRARGYPLDIARLLTALAPQ